MNLSNLENSTMSLHIINYEEFSDYFDQYERLADAEKQRELSQQETIEYETAGISIASLPTSVAKDYLDKKTLQLNKSYTHAKEVLRRLNNS